MPFGPAITRFMSTLGTIIVYFSGGRKRKSCFLIEEKRATFLKQCGYPRRKRAEKEAFLSQGLTRFFFLTMYLIGRQKELKCCLLAENLFIRGFV